MANVVPKTSAQIAALAPVQSVVGRTGDVVLSTSDITGLTTELAGKASVTHTHAISDVTGLDAALSGKQPVDATLTAFAGVTTAADKLVYATGPDAFATTDLTSFARSVLDDADAATARGTLGIAVGNNGFHDSAPVNDDVVYWLVKSQVAFTINGLYGVQTTSGTCTFAVKINGTAVGGLSSVSASSTSQDVAASGSNSVAVGDTVTIEYSAASSPVNLRFNLKDTR